MGKTPKEKVNERRRPYNYLRNTQAQGQFSGNETRNYYYPPGSVQRPLPYHRLRAPVPNQFHRGPYRGELYRDCVSNIPKLGKPFLGRRLPNKKILSPLNRAARRNMQSASEEQNSQHKESTGELMQQQELQEQHSKDQERNLKNGPSENKSNIDSDKDKMENGLAADAVEASEKADHQDPANMDDANPTPKAKSGAKEKKTKKSETTTKPKGKHSPKTAKDKKSESIEAKKSEQNETESDDTEVENKDKKPTKKARKETEDHQTASQISLHDKQPTVKVLRLNSEMLANAEMNDNSIVEVPVENQEKQDALPSTSSDWPASTKASSRRSTRLQEQKNNQDESINTMQKNDPDDSIVLLENKSVTVTEVNRSYGEALLSIKGRRSFKILPHMKLPCHRQTTELQSSSFSSRVPSVANKPDPVDEELKRKSYTSMYHKSSKSVSTTSDVSADNDLATAINFEDSAAEESGSELDVISSKPSSASTDLNVSGKRKNLNIQSVDEKLHESKRFRSTEEEQNSSGYLSIIYSPIKTFASKIKSGKSSTPIHVDKVSALAGEDSTHTEDISEIPKEESEENGESFIEKSKKENLEVMTESQGGQVNTPQKKLCSIM